MGCVFPLSWPPPGLLGAASMWRLRRAGRACCWREGVCGGSFVWSAAPVSLYSLRFAPNFGCYLVSFGPLAAGGGTCWRYMLWWIFFVVARQPRSFVWLVSNGTWKATKQV